MTETQFDLLCKVKNISAATHHAMLLHLFAGTNKYQASKQAGVLPQNLNRTLKKLRELDAQIREVYQ